MSIDERRKEIISKFTDSREELMAAIEGLSEQEMLELSIDGWSVKDHLTHISVWDELRFVEILRIGSGLKPAVPLLPPEEMDQFNNLNIKVRRERPLDQVLAELQFTRDRILDALANADEAALDQANYYAVGLEGGVEHEQEHILHIRNWRTGRASSVEKRQIEF